jgi:hypothetical protein
MANKVYKYIPIVVAKKQLLQLAAACHYSREGRKKQQLLQQLFFL